MFTCVLVGFLVKTYLRRDADYLILFFCFKWWHTKFTIYNHRIENKQKGHSSRNLEVCVPRYVTLHIFIIQFLASQLHFLANRNVELAVSHYSGQLIAQKYMLCCWVALLFIRYTVLQLSDRNCLTVLQLSRWNPKNVNMQYFSFSWSSCKKGCYYELFLQCYNWCLRQFFIGMEISSKKDYHLNKSFWWHQFPL